jgi:5-methylcytosine-specific restriction endonuclease McrBC regulatory subunit McrC
MSEREEIRKRVENFRKFQERLAAEREARINRVNQRILHMLDEMRSHHPKLTSSSLGKADRPNS